VRIFLLFLATASAQSLPKDHLSVPLVRQATTYSCGAAALLSIFYYWNVYDGPEVSLWKRLHTTEKDGTEPEPIARVARELHLRAQVRREVSLEEVRAALARGETVILDLQAWPDKKRDWSSDWDDGHYVVLVGADERFFYVMDPSTPAEYAYLAIDEFLTRWHDEERVGGKWKHVQHLAIFISGPQPSPRPSLSPMQ
jgi:predicted double-glycine peptidase